MKNLRDIKTKKGDIIYFTDGRTITVNNWRNLFSNYDEIEYNNGKIKKIERSVKYETIYETPKQILDEEEKEYLENVIRPFKNKVEGIAKFSGYKYIKEYITIKMQDEDETCLPYFNAGSMYKGMETAKNYTIKELGLFEGEK